MALSGWLSAGFVGREQPGSALAEPAALERGALRMNLAPLADRELSEQDSTDAFKIIVTLREAIEAADGVERRLQGTSDLRYARFLAKARDRHLQIAETARGLLVDMIMTMSGDGSIAKGGRFELAKRSD
jgi:hypothetical protein